MKKKHLLPRVIKTIILLVMAFVVYVHLHGDWRNLFVRDFYFKNNLKRINCAIVLYAKENKAMPSASIWADLIKDVNPLILKEDFITPMSYSDYGIYFNKALENKSLADLKENTVVLFTAKGEWNSNSDMKNFLEKSLNLKHSYVITLNGDIYKYHSKDNTFLKLKDSQVIDFDDICWE